MQSRICQFSYWNVRLVWQILVWCYLTKLQIYLIYLLPKVLTIFLMRQFCRSCESKTFIWHSVQELDVGRNSLQLSLVKDLHFHHYKVQLTAITEVCRSRTVKRFWWRNYRTTTKAPDLWNKTVFCDCSLIFEIVVVEV